MTKNWLLVLIFTELSDIVMMTVLEDEFFPTAADNNQIQNNVSNETRYTFFRDIDSGLPPGSESRRVFGGVAVELKDFKAVCALLDRNWAVRCTATVLNPYWVVTAAHCITPRIAFVKYNTRRPSSADGNITSVLFLYRHPNYRAVHKDEGRGPDVVTLHHDVGLVRTADKIQLDTTDSVISALRSNNALDMFNKDVKVLGFGRTERSVLGEELFAVDLHLVGCEREDWMYCVCGIAREAPRGVCSGDSGGPVLYEGSLVAVTSMGPVECAQNSETPPSGATSVFTTLYQYVDVINATILDTEAALRMRKISYAPKLCSSSLLLLSVFFVFPVR